MLSQSVKQISEHPSLSLLLYTVNESPPGSLPLLHPVEALSPQRRNVVYERRQATESATSYWLSGALIRISIHFGIRVSTSDPQLYEGQATVCYRIANYSPQSQHQTGDYELNMASKAGGLNSQLTRA